jgi:hypothetical protein
MLRAFLILAGNSERVAGYLESIKDPEQREKQFSKSILPKLTSLTDSIEIISGPDADKTDPEFLRIYMNAGVTALTDLLSEGIPPKSIAEEILAHDKSYYRSWSTYPDQLRERVSKSKVDTILPQLQELKLEYSAELKAIVGDENKNEDESKSENEGEKGKSEPKDYSDFLWLVVGGLMGAKIISDGDGLKKFAADLKTAFPEIPAKDIDDFLKGID